MRTDAKVLAYILKPTVIMTCAFLVYQDSSYAATTECQSYVLGDRDISSIYTSFLEESGDRSITVCGESTYYANSQVKRSNGVCYYTRYPLVIRSLAGVTLERPSNHDLYGAPSEAVRLDSNGVCPDPERTVYTGLDGVSHDKFIDIVSVVEKNTGSVEEFNRSFSRKGDKDAIDGLRLIIEDGHDFHENLYMVRLISDFLFIRNYVVVVSDPNNNGLFYGIHISNYFGKFYHIYSTELIII